LDGDRMARNHGRCGTKRVHRGGSGVRKAVSAAGPGAGGVDEAIRMNCYS